MALGVVVGGGGDGGLFDDGFFGEDGDILRDSECNGVGGSCVDMGEVAVGFGDGELSDEGAVDEVDDGDRFEGGAEAFDDVGEEVVGHGAWEVDPFESTSDGGGFDDPDDDGE